jgi:hypothetical protein
VIQAGLSQPATRNRPAADADEPSGPAPVALHRRTIEYEAYDVGDDVAVVGRLRDVRPWAEAYGAVERVHDMELRVTVRVDDLTITAAEAVMHTFPHAECPSIQPAFRGLVGLSVARGYTREVQQRFAGVRGCTHLEQVARSMGPFVIQAVTSRRALARARGDIEHIFDGGGTPLPSNTCHVWAEGGVAEQKLASGWQPGTGPYPSPAVATFVAARQAAADAGAQAAEASPRVGARAVPDAGTATTEPSEDAG